MIIYFALEVEVGRGSGIQKNFKTIIFRLILTTVKRCIWWFSDAYDPSFLIFLYYLVSGEV